MRNAGIDDEYKNYGNNDINRASSLKRLYGLFKPHLWKLLVSSALALAATSASVFMPKIAGDLIDNLSELSLAELNKTALILLALISFSAILRYISSCWLSYIGITFLRELRERLFNHILSLSLGFFQKRQAGELNSRIMTNLEFIQEMLTVSMFVGMQGVFTMLGAVILLFYTNPKLTFVALLVCVPIVVLSIIYTRLLENVALKVDDNLATSSANVEEVINGISTVQSFGNEKQEASRYRTLMGRLMRSQFLEVKRQSAYESLLDFFGFSAVAVVIWYGGQQIINGELSVGNLTTCLMYMLMFALSIEDVGKLVGELGELSGVSHRVLQLLDEDPVVKDRGKLTINDNDKLDITFSNVSFSYADDQNKKVIQNLSLTIKEGDEVAIVGPSGSGKTTILKLLLRFYDPDAGNIYINKNNLCDYSLNSLRNYFGLVSQDVFLFSGTILENIRYGNSDASLEDIKKAIESVGAASFIESLKNGLDEQVGVGGAKLSGGQKQLLAIIRVYLKNPKILLLDEATSSLDSESEERVQNSLKKLKQNRTTITIAHRFSTVRDSKKILLLKEGKFIAMGDHEYLINHSELYKKYWYWQSSEVKMTEANVLA